MKKLLLVATLGLLAACSTQAKKNSHGPTLPEEEMLDETSEAVFFENELIASDELEQSTPGLEALTLAGLEHHGSGCKEGTVSSLLSPDSKAITIIFDEFLVEVDGQSRKTRRDKKSCKLKLQLNTPPGWAFAIFSTQLRGFTSLDEGAKATLKTSIQAGRRNRTVREQFVGGFDDNFDKEIKLPVKSLPWAGCRKKPSSILLKTELAAAAKKGATGVITLDSIDGSLSQNYEIAWRRCPH